jgi:hypothetical protein
VSEAARCDGLDFCHVDQVRTGLDRDARGVDDRLRTDSGNIRPVDAYSLCGRSGEQSDQLRGEGGGMPCRTFGERGANVQDVHSSWHTFLHRGEQRPWLVTARHILPGANPV